MQTQNEVKCVLKASVFAKTTYFENIEIPKDNLYTRIKRALKD